MNLAFSIRRVRRALLLTIAMTLLAAAPAAAALPDTWTRWITPDLDQRDAWVRSLDFIGPSLYAATEGDGVFNSTTGPLGPWNWLNSDSDPAAQHNVRQVVTNGASVYAATTAGLFRSLGGAGWQPVAQEPGPRKLNMGGIQTIFFNSPSDMVVGVASGGVHYSGDGGANWDKAAGFPAAESVFYVTRGIAPGLPLYAAASSGVYTSVDLGRSWTQVSDGLPFADVLRVSVEPTNPLHLYAATTAGIYRSETGGITWSKATGSGAGAIGSEKAHALIMASGFGTERFVVGTTKGVWATMDDGATWGKMSSTATLPDPGVPAFGDQDIWALNVGAGYLLAGSHGWGAYTLPLQPIAVGTIGNVAPNANLTEGEKLTAPAATWGGTAPFFLTYQWLRCDDDLANDSCAPIGGATGREHNLTSADVGSRIRVRIYAKNLLSAGGATVNQRSIATGIVAAPPAEQPQLPAPGQAQPGLTPNDKSYAWGQTFTLSRGGTWRVNGVPTQMDSFAYQWERCNANGTGCAPIPGADDAAYTATVADVNKKLNGYVTGTKDGAARTTLAGQTLTIIERFPLNTDKPRITGEALTGRTLNSSAGAWEANQPTFARRWLRCEADGLGCNPIGGATATTYAVTAADRGKRLQLEITATVQDPNQNRVTKALSEPTAVIADPPANPAPPAGGGDPAPPGGGDPQPPAKPLVKIAKPNRVKVGAKLAVPARFAGFTGVRYQWLRNGKPIKRATKRTYRLGRKDRGKKIACRLTLTGAAGTQVVVTKAIKVPRKR